MPSLAEIQRQLRCAIVDGETTALAPALSGGPEALRRLAIHQRHYEASLAAAIATKFPATQWLVGTPFLIEAARVFVRESPPRTPCIADYGERFPQFLSRRPNADRVPYLESFAELEWHVGHASIAIDYPAKPIAALAGIAADALMDVTLTLQPGVRYMRARWPIDELMHLFLTESASPRIDFAAADTNLEIRGARGEFHITRMDRAEFAFRQALQGGDAVGTAAERARDDDAAFDPGRSFARLFGGGLVVEVQSPTEVSA